MGKRMRGYVYQIVNDQGMKYIGSTRRPLARRLREHYQRYMMFKQGMVTTNLSVFKVFEGGMKWWIELVEDVDMYNCDIMPYKMLRLREYYHMNNIQCVNERTGYIHTHTCTCGVTLSRGCRWQVRTHVQSKRHQKYLTTLQDETHGGTHPDNHD